MVNWFLTKGGQNSLMGKEKSFQQMVLGKLDIHMQKNEFGPLSHTKQKINS